MSNEIVKQSDVQFSAVEQVVIAGDLAKLSPEQRVSYYNRVCESLGLNPYTQPFAYISLSGKLTLYARKDATEQLRRIHGMSITRLDGQIIDDLYIVTASAMTRDGRTDQATGAVSIAGLKGEPKANAIMKAETKAKRRVTLSIAGLGWADESEVDSIQGVQTVTVDGATGEIMTQAKRIAQTNAPEQSSGYKVAFNAPTSFVSVDAALKWGWEQNCFRAVGHVKNAYDKLKAERKPKTSQEMFALWIEDVARRVDEQANEAEPVAA